MDRNVLTHSCGGWEDQYKMPISGVGFLDGRDLVAGGKRKQGISIGVLP